MPSYYCRPFHPCPWGVSLRSSGSQKDLRNTVPPTSTRTYPTFSPDSRSSQFLKNHQFCTINSDFTALAKGECPRRASSLIRANSGGRDTEVGHADMGRMQGNACLTGRALSPLQERRRNGISGSPHVRLLTCPICSCKSPSLSASLHCWNAFLNTVIYPPRTGSAHPCLPSTMFH